MENILTRPVKFSARVYVIPEIAKVLVETVQRNTEPRFMAQSPAESWSTKAAAQFVTALKDGHSLALVSRAYDEGDLFSKGDHRSVLVEGYLVITDYGTCEGALRSILKGIPSVPGNELVLKY